MVRNRGRARTGLIMGWETTGRKWRCEECSVSSIPPQRCLLTACGNGNRARGIGLPDRENKRLESLGRLGPGPRRRKNRFVLLARHFGRFFRVIRPVREQTDEARPSARSVPGQSHQRSPAKRTIGFHGRGGRAPMETPVHDPRTSNTPAASSSIEHADAGEDSVGHGGRRSSISRPRSWA